MTPQEFKSWFEGFTEAMSGVPTKAQWARVKDRVGEIDGKAVTERVYVDRYIHRYWPTWTTFTATGDVIPCDHHSVYYSNLQNLQGVGSANSAGVGSASFNGLTAMNALGRAEAASLTAGG